MYKYTSGNPYCNRTRKIQNKGKLDDHMTEVYVKQNRLGPSKVKKRRLRQNIISKMPKEHNMNLSI